MEKMGADDGEAKNGNEICTKNENLFNFSHYSVNMGRNAATDKEWHEGKMASTSCVDKKCNVE